MRMRMILILVPTLAVTACGGGGKHTGLRVVASFYPLAFAAEQVAPRGTNVDDLTPPGVEPHDLELKPTDVRALDRADLVLLLGFGFQPQVEKAAGSGPNVLRLLDHAGDPHVWLDPVRYAEIVERVGRALRRPAPAARLAARVRALGAEYRRGLADCARRDVVTGHAAFGYLAARYGLHQIAVTGLTPEAEPTPRALQEVIDAVKKSKATTVFAERLVSPRLAETVARETGATVEVLDPIEGLTKDEAKRGLDYFGLMRQNLRSLREALGCR